MEFTFTVQVEVSRVTGKFASRDEIAAQIQEALDNANPGSLTGDNGGEYETVTWDVSEDAPAPPPGKVAAPAPEQSA